jgi:hypothetical protein
MPFDEQHVVYGGTGAPREMSEQCLSDEGANWGQKAINFFFCFFPRVNPSHAPVNAASVHFNLLPFRPALQCPAREPIGLRSSY